MVSKKCTEVNPVHFFPPWVICFLYSGGVIKRGVLHMGGIFKNFQVALIYCMKNANMVK